MVSRNPKQALTKKIRFVIKFRWTFIIYLIVDIRNLHQLRDQDQSMLEASLSELNCSGNIDQTDAAATDIVW